MYQQTHVYIERDLDQLFRELSFSPGTALRIETKNTPGTMYLNTYTHVLHVHPEDYRWLLTVNADQMLRWMINDLCRTRHDDF